MTDYGLTPETLFRRGQLAKLLGVQRNEIRWIPGVLDEVRTRVGTRYKFRRTYLTRTQVARKLHKSRTAVIAIEGRLLHPELGPGDVRLFDVDDVVSLVGKPFGEVAHSRWFDRKAKLQGDYRHPERSKASTSTNQVELRRLQRENEQLRAMIADHLEIWTQVQFSFAQRRLQRRVGEMLAAHLDILGVG